MQIERYRDFYLGVINRFFTFVIDVQMEIQALPGIYCLTRCRCATCRCVFSDDFGNIGIYGKDDVEDGVGVLIRPKAKSSGGFIVWDDIIPRIWQIKLCDIQSSII